MNTITEEMYRWFNQHYFIAAHVSQVVIGEGYAGNMAEAIINAEPHSLTDDVITEWWIGSNNDGMTVYIRDEDDIAEFILENYVSEE